MRGRVGRFDLGKIQGNFQQVRVAQWVHQLGHQCVMPPPGFEADQLVVQVARRFARQTRVIAVSRCTPLVAVAGGAGLGALGNVVPEGWRRRRVGGKHGP